MNTSKQKMEIMRNSENRKEGLSMSFYHSWIYETILNTRWFMWTIVVTVLALNIISPILIWFVTSSKKLSFTKDKQSSE
jgi:hypothetical protein